VSSPTFSPDGTQIAYLVQSRPDEFHVWVADADGSGAHEILANEPVVTPGGPASLVWSPAGDRIAMEGGVEGAEGIYIFASDGSDFTKVISRGINPFWSPDGSQIAYTLPYDPPPGGGSPGLAIADVDGSNVRELGLAMSGPWHPGTLEKGAGG
jgi:Tol biopolymer transport system component